MIPPTPRSTLFPYTTLFRSRTSSRLAGLNPYTDYGESLRASRLMCPRKKSLRRAAATGLCNSAETFLSLYFIKQKIAHGVAPRRLGRQPERGPQSTPGEDGAIARPVGQGELLPLAGEQHFVLPDDVPRTNHREPDLALAAPSGAARGPLARRPRLQGSAPLGSRLRQRERGSGRRVPLQAVVGFNDVDVKVDGQSLGRRAHQLQQQCNGDAGVRGDKQRNIARNLIKHGCQLVPKTRRAKQQRRVCRAARHEIATRHLRV